MDYNLKQYRKFKKNTMAMFGLGQLVVMIFIAIFGYLMAPDSTQNANTQLLHLKLNYPGSNYNLLLIPQEKNQSSMSSIFFGKDAWKEIRVLGDSFYISDQVLHYQMLHKSVWNSMELSNTNYKIKKFTFWLGTDGLGRDVLSRLIIGTRISLLVGLISVIISLLLGSILGALSGYYGGIIDKIVLWMINVFWAIPTILLAMALLIGIKTGNETQILIVFLAVGLTMWVDTARMVRGQFLVLKQLPFVEATRSFGYSDYRIVFKHIFPNIFNSLIVITASNFATAILMESGLSYLGIGVQPPTPSWGSMMKEYYAYLGSDLSYLAIFPGLCIMIAVLSFYSFGNGLRDAFDIKGQ